MAVDAIGRHRDLLSGTGIDWGSGSGCLAIAAARVEGVDRVVGLEIDREAVATAAHNVARNGVAARVTMLWADSVTPRTGAGSLDVPPGTAGFLIANPPPSTGDDGLGFRRRALRDTAPYLAAGAPALVQVSYQYGSGRIRRLADDVPGYRYERLLASTDWVPFDLDRPDLAVCLDDYAAEEARGGLAYSFADEALSGHITATEALARHRATGMSPLSKWQIHLFRRTGMAVEASGGE
jgi:hypothetical protein